MLVLGIHAVADLEASGIVYPMDCMESVTVALDIYKFHITYVVNMVLAMNIGL